MYYHSVTCHMLYVTRNSFLKNSLSHTIVCWPFRWLDNAARSALHEAGSQSVPCHALRLLRPSCSPPQTTSSFLYSTMSQDPSTSTSSSNFEDIFSDALKTYKKQTKKDIASHPLATQIKSCDSSSAIIAILRTQVQNFDQSSQGADERWTKWLDPTVNVLFAFSATLGHGVGVVSSPSSCFFSRDLPSDVCDHRHSHPPMQYLPAWESSSK